MTKQNTLAHGHW